MTDTQTATPAPASAGKLPRVRMASLGLVSMLILQFILGVGESLYGTAPTAAKSISMFSSGWLILHDILALLLLLAAIMLVVRAMGAGSGLAMATSWIGLVAIIAAIGSGISFTRNGDNGSSLGMSLAFAVALACYVINLARLPSGES